MTGHDEHYGFMYHTCACNRFDLIDSLRSALDRDSEFRMSSKVRETEICAKEQICAYRKDMYEKNQFRALFYETAFVLDKEKARERGNRNLSIYLKKKR